MNTFFCKFPQRTALHYLPLIVFALFCNALTVFSQNRIVNNPPFSVCSHSYVIIDKIELKDTETYPDSTGRVVFALHFPAIAPSTQQIDFIESDCSNCFKICGIELKPGIPEQRSKVPDEVKNEALTITDDGKSLAIPQLKSGDAIFKGQFLGYVPEMNWKIELSVDNPVTGEQEEVQTPIKDDGSFELKIPLITTMQVLFRTTFYNKYILLSPDKETTLYVDLYQKSCQETANEALKCPSGKYMYFGGANAEINNQMEDKNIQRMSQDLYDACLDYNAILNMSAEQYKTYVLGKVNNAVEKLSQKGLTKKAYEFAVMGIHFNAMQMLMFADILLKNAYRKAHNLNSNDKMTGYTEPVFDKAYYSFLKELYFNNPLSLYINYFENIVNQSKYFYRDSGTVSVNLPSKAFYQRLIDSGKLDDKITQLAKELISMCDDSKTGIISVEEKNVQIVSSLKNNENFSREDIGSLMKQLYLLRQGREESDSIEEQKFSAELKELFNLKIQQSLEKERINKAKSDLADILETSQGIAFDMMTAQFYCENLPLTADELNEVAQMENPFYSNYINQKNNELLAQIEKNKREKGYNIHDTPETDNENFLSEILKPFAGRVILIDFWATWCGPCRSAMKEFEPVKERLKGKDIAFIYLTDAIM